MIPKEHMRFKLKVARWISQLSAPPLLLLLTAILVSKQTTAGIDWKSLGAYCGVSILGPLVVLLILKSYGKVGDFDLTRREERTIPLISASVASGLAFLLLLSRADCPQLTAFVGVQTGLLSALTCISLFWKISIHASGVTALVTVLDTTSLGMLTVGILMFLLVCWARVVLGKHSIGQFLAGGGLTAFMFTCSRMF